MSNAITLPLKITCLTFFAKYNIVFETGFKEVVMKKLTINNIAELANVSKATVSRVINGYPHIRPELRERVEKVIAETGFQPNNVARSLALDRSNMIGLVIPSGAKAVFTDPYFPELTEGISRLANQEKLMLALFIFHSEQEGREVVKSILSKGMIDGLIITADRKGNTFIPQLIEYEMPFVLIGQSTNSQNANYNFVDTDNLAGGYLATEHLIQLGYRRIATIASAQNVSGDERLNGYRQALVDHQIPFDNSLIAMGNYSLEGGYTAMKQLIPVKPDAVFAASDTMAVGALRALREAGLKVPDDVALVGYDDLPPALQADPQLTTIRQPIAKTGSLALELLIEIIDHPEQPPRHIILPNELIIRNSCGAATARS